jgi:chromate transporter
MTPPPPAPQPPDPSVTPAEPSPSLPPPAQSQPTIAELFIAFARISLSGFGGVLAWSRRIMVEERKWLTPEQFNEIYALSAMLPGGNILNVAVMFGGRLRGVAGAIAAVVGLMGPPVLLIMVIGAIYAHYGDLPALRRMLTGVASAAAGLLIATVAKMLQPLFRNRAFTGPLIALATFVAIGIMQWPLPLVLAVILPTSIGIAWVRL